MRRYFFLGLYLLASWAWAEGLADSFNSMLYFTNNFVDKIVIITGSGLCVGGLIQFKQHRDNPIAVPLSKPIWMILIGLMLVGLAYIPNNITASLDPTA